MYTTMNTLLLAFVLFWDSILTEKLPDLVPDPSIISGTSYLEVRPLPDLTCALEENCASSSAYNFTPNTTVWFNHKRQLFRFSTSTWNFGNTDFRPVRKPEDWEWHDCHEHYHSMEHFASYDILYLNGTEAAEGHKASYCLADTRCVRGHSTTYRCKGKDDQGISVGCYDLYKHDVDCQWIDLTDVPVGQYIFKTHVNPNNMIPESNYNNNVVTCKLDYTGSAVDVTDCHIDNLNLGQPCVEDSDCKDPNSECSTQTCKCKANYREYQIQDYYSFCTVDCLPSERHSCLNGGTLTCPYDLLHVSKAQWQCECLDHFTGEQCHNYLGIPWDCDTGHKHHTLKYNNISPYKLHTTPAMKYIRRALKDSGKKLSIAGDNASYHIDLSADPLKYVHLCVQVKCVANFSIHIKQNGGANIQQFRENYHLKRRWKEYCIDLKHITQQITIEISRSQWSCKMRIKDIILTGCQGKKSI